MSVRLTLVVVAFAILVDAGALPAAAGSVGLTKASRVSFWGIGPVRVGMTIEEAERVIGARLIGLPMGMGDDCQEVSREDGKDVAGFIAINGVIRRVDVAQAGILTLSGVGVGDTEETVKRVYGTALRVEPHFYDREGHYLIVDSPDGRNEVLFETDGKRVTSFRAGRREEVGYVEGCA